jgi:drug/metabolite transporter (DMT)-like permease
MATKTRNAYLALTAAGLLWGLTVPLSKAVLGWLDGGWLTVVRFALAAPLLALAGRRGLRAALTPRVLLAGAVGYGLVIVLQNAGIERTSVSHAALIVGAVPALVALVSALSGHGRTSPRAAAGLALALAGVGIVAGGSGGAASPAGDALVLASVTLSATFVVVQPALLRGRDPMAVTAVQMLAGALAATPNAALEGLPAAPAGAGPVLALAALATLGTLAPFALFAFGQSRTSPAKAGAFLNLEPLVGAAVGALAFGDPLGPAQLAGALAILLGIGFSTAPGGAGGRTRLVAIRTRRRKAPPSIPSARRGRLLACTPASIRSPSPAPRTRSGFAARAEHVSRRPHGPLLTMTLLAPPPDRTTAPRVYVTPVVRELPSIPAAAGASPAW